MASLKPKHQEFIVTRLACYDKPSDVRQAFRDEFGIDVSLDQIVYYSPKSANGSARLAEHWVELFNETRERFLTDASTVPAANKMYRVRRLEKAADKAYEMRNYVLFSSLYEQIAKEMGEAYTNRRLLEHTGKDGGAIEIRGVDFRDGGGE